MMWLKLFVLLFFHVGMLFGEFAPAIDLDDCGNAAFVEIGDDDEFIFVYPDGDGLEV